MCSVHLPRKLTRAVFRSRSYNVALFFCKNVSFTTKSPACRGKNVRFFAPAGRGFCRKSYDSAKKECNNVRTEAGEGGCQFSAGKGRSYMENSHNLISGQFTSTLVNRLTAIPKDARYTSMETKAKAEGCGFKSRGR